MTCAFDDWLYCEQKHAPIKMYLWFILLFFRKWHDYMVQSSYMVVWRSFSLCVIVWLRRATTQLKPEDQISNNNLLPTF